MLKKEGQGMKHPAPWGTSPDISQHRFWRPGRGRTSTGARLLEVHQVSRQRREKASQKSGQHIPEEVLHGVTLLSEDGPKGNLAYISGVFNAAIPRSFQRFSTPGLDFKNSACCRSIPSNTWASRFPRPAFSTSPPRLHK